MKCACIHDADLQLKFEGACVRHVIAHQSTGRLMAARAVIATQPLDPERPVHTTVVARYCPFCGTKYED